MTVSPETLDTALCEWCSNSTVATGIAELMVSEPFTYLCSTHCQEVASEFREIKIWPVTKPEYSVLESGAEPMTGEWTIQELELAARYGAPYPVCGDLTAKKRWDRAKFLERVELVIPPKESWTGHDPNGTQY